MKLLSRRHVLLDRRVLGGRLYLGSVLFAGVHFGFGVLLWFLNGYIDRTGVDPRWLLLTLSAVSLATVFRRVAPHAALAGATVAIGVDALLGPSVWTFVVYGDALYAVCVWGRRRVAYAVLGIVVLGNVALLGVLAYAMLAGYLPGGLLDLLQLLGLYALLFVMPLITGLSIREHHLRAELERQRARQVERMAELDRANAIGEERGRMARELHDVIANHLSAVAVQSTAVLSLPELDPERARQALTVVRDNSVQGLAEMRRMVEVLRAEDQQGDLDRVMPRLSEVDRLVDNARGAGLDVHLSVDGTGAGGASDVDLAPVRLPAQVDAAAYRVVQESLTNALRHAEPKRVEIAISHVPDGAGGRLVLTAENPLRDDAEGEVGLGGEAGLTGMRERVTLLGGVFDAGPVGADRLRWRVRAELPVARQETEDEAEGADS